MTAALPPVTCVRCGAAGPADPRRRYLGCAPCRSAGVAANFQWTGDPGAAASLLGRNVGTGMWRFAAALPVRSRVALGEGDTPLVPLGRLATDMGVRQLLVKNESVNPTWSHKDRLAAVTVAAACDAGARVVAAASTGNHGAAVAAYAARAGLRCVIATVASSPPALQQLMVGYGAAVVATATGPERYAVVADGVERHGWYPASNITAPAVGSDPYGIAGYRTIAYEIVERLGAAPDWVVLPVAYGDCLAGVARGFAELQAAGVVSTTPRLAGAEVFGVLQQALAGGGLGPVPRRPTAAFSIASAYATFQAVTALQASNGVARSVTEDEIAAERRALAVTEGLAVEAAAAAPFAAVRKLVADGLITDADRIVCLLTSTGLKDLGRDPTAVPVVAPDLDEVRAALRSGGLHPDAEREIFAAGKP